METLWTYKNGIHSDDVDLSGYDVEATDGSIGSVDESSIGRDHLVVDTGFWIFGKRRLLPAGVVTLVDHENKSVSIDMTKSEVKDAPDIDDVIYRSDQEWDRTPHTSYYDGIARPF